MRVQRAVATLLGVAVVAVGCVAFAQKGGTASEKTDPSAKPRPTLQVEYVHVGPRNPALYTPIRNGGDFAPAEGNQTTIDVTGTPSYGGLGDTNNTRLSINVGSDDLWNGMGWDVTITATAPSWLSEVAVLITNVNGEGYVLRPGAGNTTSGTGSFSSGGVLKLTTGFGVPDIPLPDNTLYLEFYETLDDGSVAPDGNWDSGTITFQTTVAPPFEGWDEQENGGGDAGDLPETAQNTSGDNIPAIRGSLDANDVDLYAIYIADPFSFSASTVGTTAFDTQLWLFDANGNGVVHNDDAPEGGLQSRIDNSTFCIPGPGLYYLAVSRYNRDPGGCDGGLIWNNTPFGAIRCPDGPEATSRVAGWSGTTSAGSYVIQLTGVAGATRGDPNDCPPPPPDVWQELVDGGSDAGDLPATAQVVTRPDQQPCQDPVTRIRGDHEADGVDMYVICITDPNTFVASTIGGAGWDTQLWLFRCDGTGVVANDDTSGLQSQIDNSLGCITEPGIYLLVISRFNRDAVDANGALLWSSGTLSCADNTNPIAGWTGSTAAGGAYSITLQGAYFVSPQGCDTGPSCEGDANNDGVVDDADLLIVLFNFGQSGFNIPGDVNNDGTVDDADLLIVLFNFGCGS